MLLAEQNLIDEVKEEILFLADEHLGQRLHLNDQLICELIKRNQHLEDKIQELEKRVFFCEIDKGV
jgi:hypothetical protein